MVTKQEQGTERGSKALFSARTYFRGICSSRAGSREYVLHIRSRLERTGIALGRLLRRAGSLKVQLIVPYVVLTIFTAMIGTYVVTRLVSSSARERFLNQLFEASRVSADGVLRVEREHLSNLRLMAYTSGVSEAIAAHDEAALQDLIWPLAMNNGMEVVSVLGNDGQAILTLVVDPQSGRTRSYQGEDFASVGIVKSVLSGEQDDLGDKFSGFIETRSGTYLFTSAPVKDDEGKLTGVILAGTQVNSMLADLKQQIMADMVFMDLNGEVLGSTFPEVEEGVESLGLTPLEMDELEDNQVLDLEVNRRRYLAAYTPLEVREEVVGYKAVALCSDYLVSTETTSRNVFSVVFTGATMGVILIGYFLSRSIADPILKLQSAARSIAEGDLDQRSGLKRRDEVGQLAAVFDLMTFRLRRRTAQAARLYAETLERNEELKQINARLQSTQNQLVQSEKLAAVGQLTAGIVHDVRNPLAVIKGLSEEMDESLDISDRTRETMRTIRDSASRAAGIVSDLLTFARQSTPTRRRQDIVGTLQTALRLTDYLIRKARVEVRTQFPEKPVILEYDAHQIEQVIVNLIQNAIQAMPDGGTLSISVKTFRTWARIIVEDTGTGIQPENIHRIFDPFFTTKDEGEGTGLCLSVSYGIITRHGGTIDVESEPNRGTSFCIDLPLNGQEGEEDGNQDPDCG